MGRSCVFDAQCTEGEARKGKPPISESQALTPRTRERKRMNDRVAFSLLKGCFKARVEDQQAGGRRKNLEVTELCQNWLFPNRKNWEAGEVRSKLPVLPCQRSSTSLHGKSDVLSSGGGPDTEEMRGKFSNLPYSRFWPRL